MIKKTFEGDDRRKSERILKSITLTFYIKNAPKKRSDASLIKDISRGGIRFTTSEPYIIGTIMVLDLRIPYIAPNKLTLEGLVISSKEFSPNLVYETRVQFVTIDQRAEKLLVMIEERTKKERKIYGLS